MRQLVLSTTTALLLLVCVAYTSGQRCYPITAGLLQFGICRGLNGIMEDARGTTFPTFRQSGVTVSNIKVLAFDPDPGLCRVRLQSNRNMKLTLGIRYLRVTGNISRRRLFRTRRGSFSARATYAVLTCSIPSNGSGRCIIPEDVECAINGYYKVSVTGRLLGIIAKRRIRSRVQKQIVDEIEDILETELRERLERRPRRP